ncbi:Pectinesterase inhibitor [Hordeum vulgare]|nr:Pectinesterase inhibitor [Hordeum vulgare]
MQTAMAGTATTSIAAVLVVLVVVSCGLPAAHTDATFISKTCKKTKHAALCVSVLGLDQDSVNASTVHDLAGVALEISTVFADFEAGNIRVGARFNQGTPVGDALSVCFRAYIDATDDLKLSAKQSLDGGDYAGASKIVMGAKAAGGVCDNALKRIKMDFHAEVDRDTSIMHMILVYDTTFVMHSIIG